ncbi:MAG: lipopolysaccharide kinase InaA family protein [Planctomycetota bacterium]
MRDRIRRAFTGDPAPREWRKACEAAARGVPVIKPLAVGVHHRAPRQCVYLSEGMDGAVSLGDAWGQKVTHRQLSDGVARLFAVAHERGFLHPDSHPGNILVRTAPDAPIEVVFVDVYSARLSSGVISTRHAIRALAQLDHYFSLHAARTQRLRFLAAYLAARREAGREGAKLRSLREWVAAIAASSARHADRLARQRDRRLRRSGKYFSTVRMGGGWVATVALKLERRHAYPEADVSDRSHEDWVRILSSLPAVVPEGDSGEGSLDGGRLRYEMKTVGSLLSRVKNTLAGSASRKSFERSHARRHRDLPAELILGYIEHRTAGLIDATTLIRPARKG